MKVIKKILLRIILGILIYICFIQPVLWKYTLRTFKANYSRIERTVNISGIILHREEVVVAPVSGVLLRLKKDFDRVGKEEELAIIFPTVEDYNSYVGEIERIRKYYDGVIKKRLETIELKKQEIEKTYKELLKESDILNSLVLNRQDIRERIKKLNDLNKYINTLKGEIENLNTSIESLTKERDEKVEEVKKRAISFNSVVLSTLPGLIEFGVDSKESLRNSIIRGEIENLEKNFKSILGKNRVILDGSMIRKGEPVGKIIDNLEQFALLYIVPDGITPLPHNNLDIYIGDKRVTLDLLNWVKAGINEIWLCKVRDRTYIKSNYFSLDFKIGYIEGITVPKKIVKEENNESYVFVLNGDSVEKRMVRILGGNMEYVVLDNIKEGEVLIFD